MTYIERALVTRYGDKNTKCSFAARCSGERSRLGDVTCALIKVVLEETEAVKQAKALGLRLKVEPASWHSGGKVDDPDVSVIEVCPEGAKSSRVIDGLRTLLGSEYFVEDADRATGLIEAAKVYSGELDNPDDILTEEGFSALDAITSSNGPSFHYPTSTKLSILGGELQAIDLYEESPRES